MEKLLLDWLDSTTLPLVTAIMLGFLTAISPCPLATNITAMGYIGKDIKTRSKVFINGLWFTLGTVVSYSLLALLIYLGADRLEISGIFVMYSEKIIGPLLVFIGLSMAGIIRLPIPSFLSLFPSMEKRGIRTGFDAFLLGMVLALAFCPNTAVLYFGMLIPLSINTVAGWYLPIVFAFTTAVPVVIFAWLVAFALNRVGTLLGKITQFEKWFRKLVALMFAVTGVWLIYHVYF